ncbi:MAG: nucleotide sugar dehydrogenase, partial [Bacilli bacterium]
MNTIIEKIKNKTAQIVIVGQGYVGLPLAVAFSEAQLQTIGLDVDTRKVDALNAGQSYIKDIPNERLAPLVENGTYKATTQPQILSSADVICICVPTPLNKQQIPDVSYIESVTQWIIQHAQHEVLIVLESTTYPGTTEELIGNKLTEHGFKIGTQTLLCFSPERVDPNNGKYTIENTPKVIGGVTSLCTETGVTLYEQIVQQVVPVGSTKVAEMTKLLENTFRSVNIAFINEMAKLCDIMGMSVWEVVDAASTKPFGFMPFYPGPGIGGHCIPLDPMYLAWKAKEFRFNSKFIELSQEVNNLMPFYISTKVAEQLNNAGKSLKNANILLVGAAYKPNINDVRESPTLWIYEILKSRGAKVSFYDPHVTSFLDGQQNRITSVTWDESTVGSYDMIVVLTQHDSIDWETLATHAQA